MEKEKVVILFSGGLDSTVLIYDLLKKKYDISLFGINYGQAQAIELQQASKVATLLNLQFHIADLTAIKDIFKSNTEAKINFIPNRNMIFLSLAGAYAIQNNINLIGFANQEDENNIYRDSSVMFVNSAQNTLLVGNKESVKILSPYGMLSKSDIVKIGNKLEVPFELTYSCYAGSTKHCGNCNACLKRKEAFTLAKIQDPTNYEV